MALAILCSNLKNARPESVPKALRNIEFQAFIVDHGARPESREEALNVFRQLRSRGERSLVTVVSDLIEIGISSEILTMAWPEDMQPSQLPNFEGLARKYRFQTLGKACQEMDIQHLMLAHHADDQAETVLMRILQGHRGRGLGGMKRSTSIPECYGIHGLCGSGAVDQLNVDRPENPKIAPPMKIEAGGIHILRPLLNFSKLSLQQTCEQYSMPWFEDATNSDPTVTTRNAIRHILKKHSLPRAFGKFKLLQIAKRQQNYATLLNGLVYQSRKFWTEQIEPRTGSIAVRFTNTIFTSKILDLSPGMTDTMEVLKKSQADVFQMLSLLIIHDIVDSVSPSEHLELKSFLPASRILFPALYQVENDDLSISSSVTEDPVAVDTFTIAGVIFRRCKATSSSESVEHEGAAFEDHEWHISRQPFFSDFAKHPQLEIASIEEVKPRRRDLSKYKFALWDGRYWIRAVSQTSQTLVIRPFRKNDLAQFRSSLSSHAQKQQLAKLLKIIAPDQVRFTLPCIAYTNGSVIALPSLDVNIPGSDSVVRYEIRYKSVPTCIRTEYEESYQAPFVRQLLVR